MDLKRYYGQIRETMSGIQEEMAVVASLATADGGKEGVLTEVSREVAARMVVEGCARLATEEEAAGHRARQREEHERAVEANKSSQVRLSVVTEQDLKSLKALLGGRKERA